MSTSSPENPQDRLKSAANALREKLYLEKNASTQKIQTPDAAASTSLHQDRSFVQENDPRFKQHRCFPRLSDAVHAATDFSLPLGAFFSRSVVMVGCLQSREGEEPKEPTLLRHEDEYKLRYRNGRGGTSG